MFNLTPDAAVSLVVVQTSSEEAAFRISQPQLEFRTIGWPILSAASDDTDVLVLLRGSDVSASTLRRFLSASTQALAVGVSTPEGGLSDLSQALREARMAVQFAVVGSGVAYFSTLGIFADLTSGLSAADIKAFVETKLGALRDYDQMRDSRLIQTLDCYLHSNGQAIEAAAALSIHVNTLHQRLRRIEALVGIHLRGGRGGGGAESAAGQHSWIKA